MTNHLIDLAAKVEAASGPDRYMDREIAIAVDRYAPERWLSYTASLDAAMTLVPDDGFWRLGNDGEGADPGCFKAEVLVVRVIDKHQHGKAIADTPALALTAAALRARAAA